MAIDTTEVFVQIEIPDSDMEKLDSLSHQLQSEIRELNVDAIETVHVGEAPEGTKALGEMAIGAIAIQLAPVVIPPLFELIKSWLAQPHSQPMKVKIKIGSRVAEVEYDPATMSPQELQKLVDKLTASISKRR